jgi:cobalt-zinc-cadmium efflux system membrane fusion protein
MATTIRTPSQKATKTRRKSGMRWTSLALFLVLGGLTFAAYLHKPTRQNILNVLRTVKGLASATPAAKDISPGPAADRASFDNKPWDHLLRIWPDQAEALGLRVVPVEEAKDPIKLDLSGITSYDPDSLTQIRLRFDSLVTRVYKTLGDPVSKGDALVDLYSNDLAAAKSDYQVKHVQWLYDKRLREQGEELYQKNAISKVEWITRVNNEAKSRLDQQLALDKLKVYGLTPEEIAPLLTGLDETSLKTLAENKEALAEKASMTLRSPADGMVIKRDVVPNNFYEPSSVLMVIAPLDHLRVYANVYESDLEFVQKGQVLDVKFPYMDRTITTKVDNIANQVDPETHAMRIRATVLNPGDLKSDMLIHAVLHIDPYEGDTVIPRNALVTTNNRFIVFVKKNPGAEKPDPVAKETAGKDAPMVFERREIRVRQERSDRVIVSDGLKKGEDVASNGSLILAQMYEDQATVDTGMPR